MRMAYGEWLAMRSALLAHLESGGGNDAAPAAAPAAPAVTAETTVDEWLAMRAASFGR